MCAPGDEDSAAQAAVGRGTREHLGALSGLERVTDCHTHVFPSADEGIRWQQGAVAGVPKRTGDVVELQGLLPEAGIDHAVMLLYPRSVQRFLDLREAGVGEDEASQHIRREIQDLNSWGCEQAAADARLLAFVGINARFMSAPEIEDEITRCRRSGATGVKLLMSDMEMYADDVRLWPVYETCLRLGMPILSQAGLGLGVPHPTDPWGRPSHWTQVLSTFPGLHVVLAHLAKGFEDELRALMYRFPTLYTDTSLRLSGLSGPGAPDAADHLVAYFREIGIERVLLGSNFPFVNPAGYVKALVGLPLTTAELAGIAGENFWRMVASAQAATVNNRPSGAAG